MGRSWIRLMANMPFRQISILIIDGRAIAKTGKVRATLLVALGQLANKHHIEAACIHAVATNSARSSTFQLTFFGIPEELQQRFRNVWSVESR